MSNTVSGALCWNTKAALIVVTLVSEAIFFLMQFFVSFSKSGSLLMDVNLVKLCKSVLFLAQFSLIA